MHALPSAVSTSALTAIRTDKLFKATPAMAHSTSTGGVAFDSDAVAADGDEEKKKFPVSPVSRSRGSTACAHFALMCATNPHLFARFGPDSSG